MGSGQVSVSVPSFRGEVLVCEDNEINQHYIKTHLSKVGLSVLIASNGREGVDAVHQRVERNEKPFDLVFMDIHMPIMGGLEAAGLISGMGVETPIVALTSNIRPEDRRIYREHGMNSSLCKPFTPEQLWACLNEFFVQVSRKQISDDERQAEEERQRVKLFSSFVRRNQTTYSDILTALDAGDTEMAHRLAHTLRGLAGLMGKYALQEAARVVENALSESGAGTVEKEALEKMGRELSEVLVELAPYLEQQKPEGIPVEWDREQARELFDRLEPLIRGDRAETQTFLTALRAIPETNELITKIEDYEFEDALAALERLRQTLNI